MEAKFNKIIINEIDIRYDIYYNFLFFIFFVFLSFNTYGEEIFNLQWENNDSEINEAHINDKIIISFETENIPDNMSIDIEIWKKKENKLLDFIVELHGIVINNIVELDWIIEIDFNNRNTNYFQEIEEIGYSIIDLVFIIRYNNTNISSELLEVLAMFERRVIDADTGEPFIDRPFALYTPDGKFITGRTDNEGYARVRNLRKIGYYNLIT
ncbi:MAG: hypothetical protein LBQ93_07965 [Treponema sp.]|jgi:hypothetical protein|nr:hypothetical protein [Treponema sp.]